MQGQTKPEGSNRGLGIAKQNIPERTPLRNSNDGRLKTRQHPPRPHKGQQKLAAAVSLLHRLGHVSLGVQTIRPFALYPALKASINSIDSEKKESLLYDYIFIVKCSKN